ncbi:hypothetical protein ACTFIZ_008806 [Dictyostelium cf. discoideum]
MNILSLIFYFFVCFLIFDFIKKNKVKKYDVPTLPFALPIIGHLYRLGSNPHINLTKQVEKNGIFSLWLGDIKTVVVATVVVFDCNIVPIKTFVVATVAVLISPSYKENIPPFFSTCFVKLFYHYFFAY